VEKTRKRGRQRTWCDIITTALRRGARGCFFRQKGGGKGEEIRIYGRLGVKKGGLAHWSSPRGKIGGPNKGTKAKQFLGFGGGGG